MCENGVAVLNGGNDDISILGNSRAHCGVGIEGAELPLIDQASFAAQLDERGVDAPGALLPGAQTAVHLAAGVYVPRRVDADAVRLIVHRRRDLAEPKLIAIRVVFSNEAVRAAAD